MYRPCIQCGRPASGSRGTRCATHQREQRGIYGGGWAAYSRAKRAAQPWCSYCGTSSDLTTDHQSDKVLCRSHHDALEAQRRRGSGEILAAVDAP